jgi:hypothetical protein
MYERERGFLHTFRRCATGAKALCPKIQYKLTLLLLSLKSAAGEAVKKSEVKQQ